MMVDEWLMTMRHRKALATEGLAITCAVLERCDKDLPINEDYSVLLMDKLICRRSD